MEVIKITRFGAHFDIIQRRYPLIAAALQEIFEIEESDFSIHGCSGEVKLAVEHCLRLKGSHIENFEAQLDEFMRNYHLFTVKMRSMSAEHMIDCCEDDLDDELDTQPFDYDDE